MKVNLRLAEPNPYRDFGVDPVDPVNVRELAKSIKEHGFWGGMVGRRRPGARHTIQIIAGWHRREAALKAGIEEADIFVGDFDERQTVRAYADENALQRGNTSTSLAGSVAASIREILLRGLSSGERQQNLGGPTQDGVGRDAIHKELEGVHGITENVIRTQLATLKATGAYDRIVREVTALVEAEREAELKALAEAEKATREAAEREAAAKRAREKAETERNAAKAERNRREAEALIAQKAADKKRAEEAAAFQRKREDEAKERREKAEAEAAKAKAEREAAKARETKHAPARAARDSIIKLREQPQHEITLDERVAKHFKSPHHVETFRRVATGPGKKYLPVERQEQLAKALVAMALDDGKELTSTFIESKFNEALLEPKFIQKIVNEKERAEAKAELLREGWQTKMAGHMSDFSRHARGALSDAQKLANLQRERPAGATLFSTNEFRTAVDSLKAAVRIAEGKLL